MMDSLWGDEFSLPNEKEKTKKVLNKISKPTEKKIKVEKTNILKSKKVSVEDKLSFIYQEVERVLGHYKDETLIIRSEKDLVDYIDKAIQNKVIAIDTETNNSLDPLTCKLMGPCIYTPDMKQAYIPINHIDYKTGELLPNQLNENIIKEQFQRLLDNKVSIIMHNGKFDYQVIKCTVGLELTIDWDTMIGAKILDENELSAGLKQQYIDKIDPNQEKYSIDKLFEKIEYAVVDPNYFGLYAAADSMMTYKLYEWQKDKFEQKGNEKLYSLFKDIEMKVIPVCAEMELTGIELDMDYAQLLSKKYHNILDNIDAEIDKELKLYKDKIDKWSLTEDATFHPKNKKGDGVGKSKLEQLENPINISSPTQLAILLYDILKIKTIDKKSPRGTGVDILEKIDLPLVKLILEKRETLKLLNAFIDALPERINPIDGRVHCHFNQYGAATGRFSSSDPNLQQIPSHNKEIRLMFRAQTKYNNIELNDNKLYISKLSEILTDNGWKLSKSLCKNDILILEDENSNEVRKTVKDINYNNDYIEVSVY